MSQSRKDTPRNIAIMSAATLAALGFAVWSIAHTLSPAAAPVAPAEPRLPQSDKALPEPGRPPGQPAMVPAEEEHTQNAHEQEARLAPDADPFAPLPARKPQDNPPAAAQQPVPPAAGATTPLPAPAPAPSKPVNGTSQTPAQNATFLPVLAGTLLGEQPCAVFLDEKQLSVIPVGSSLNGWKVVAVTHGRAILKRGKQVLHLEVRAEAEPAAEEPAGTENPGDGRGQQAQATAEPASAGQETPVSEGSGPAGPPAFLELPEAVLTRQDMPEAEPAAEMGPPDPEEPEPEVPEP
ncbi:MAG: hypothetical protein NZ557_06340 [Chthonomonadaceae bacterium]|nr:hypothetical protein [Chthonomonadaceae bacterium]